MIRPDAVPPSPRFAVLRAGAGARAVARLMVAGAFALSCGGPPRERLETAAQAMRRAGAAEGVTRAPEICAAAQSALVRAEAEVRLQEKRSFVSRDYREADLLVARAHLAAEICAARAVAARERERARAAAALDDLEAWIGRVDALARHAPGSAGIKDDLLQAEISLGEGRSSFARERYERAAQAAERGRGRVAIAVSDLNRFFDDFGASPRRALWRRLVRETVRESRRDGGPVILVDKLRRQLLLMRGTEELASYAVDLGAGGIESKTRAGDDATPEGRYRVTEVRGPGQTHYYRALMLDYPNAEDRARFRRLKRAGDVAPGQGIGSLIEIHGHGGRGQDWTQGCVALDNDDMDDLADKVRVGTRVTIVGTIPEGALP